MCVSTTSIHTSGTRGLIMEEKKKNRPSGLFFSRRGNYPPLIITKCQQTFDKMPTQASITKNCSHHCTAAELIHVIQLIFKEAVYCNVIV